MEPLAQDRHADGWSCRALRPYLLLHWLSCASTDMCCCSWRHWHGGTTEGMLARHHPTAKSMLHAMHPCVPAGSTLMLRMEATCSWWCHR